MNQLYKKNEYIVIPVENKFIVINTEKTFKEAHTPVREMKIARLLIDLAIDKKLPRNPAFVDRLIRITVDKEYIDRLEEFKDDAYMDDTDFKKMMQHDSYKRVGGVIKQVRW